MPTALLRAHPGLLRTAHKEGKTKREIIRCQKRYIAREAYHALQADLADLRSPRPRHTVAITCGAGFIGRHRRQINRLRHL